MGGEFWIVGKCRYCSRLLGAYKVESGATYYFMPDCHTTLLPNPGVEISITDEETARMLQNRARERRRYEREQKDRRRG